MTHWSPSPGTSSTSITNSANSSSATSSPSPAYLRKREVTERLNESIIPILGVSPIQTYKLQSGKYSQNKLLQVTNRIIAKVVDVDIESNTEQQHFDELLQE